MAEIKPAQLAKIAGLKRQAVYNAIRRGNIISNSAGLVDTQNKKNMDWMLNHNVSEKNVNQYLYEIQNREKKQKESKVISNPLPDIRKNNKKKPLDIEPEKIDIIQKYIEPKQENKLHDELEFENISGLPSEVMNLKLFELVKRHGGPMMLTGWSLILQRIMSAQQMEQKIKERRLELVEKDFVISRLMLYLETLSSQLFDYTESFPIRAISLVKSDVDSMELHIKQQMRKDFSILIKDTKERLNKELENLKRKFEKSDDSSN